MAWTKAKTAVVAGIGILLVAGTTTVTVKEIQGHRPYSWQLGNEFNSAVLDRVQPQVRIVPALKPSPARGSGWATSGEKMFGLNLPISRIVEMAYGGKRVRSVFPDGLPSEHYDFIANLAQGSRQALREEIRRKFGLLGRHGMRETDVLLLKVLNPDAPELKPSSENPQEGIGSSSGSHHWSCRNAPISVLTDYLENFIEIPVVDQTGLTDRFDIDLKLNAPDADHPDPQNLKQALLDQLGLELVATNMPIEMLVVEKAK